MSTFTKSLPTTAKHPPVHVTIPEHLKSHIDESKLFKFSPFNDWWNNLGRSVHKHENYLIKSITLQSVDLFGKPPHQKIGFIKFTAEVTDQESGEHVPGVTFMRGGAVGMLCVLEAEEGNEEPQVILTVQPRIPMATFRMVEIPAGMVDESGKFAGQAAKELKEECGLEIEEKELVDLTELTFQTIRDEERKEGREGEGDGEVDAGQIGVYTSPGGSDEFLRLFLYRKKLPLQKIKELEGKLTGNLDEGEKISLRLVPLKTLWRTTKDAKALAALALWQGLKSEGRL
ncbi:nudix hydrolase 14 [Planoprotostelium fungivorum]|uniref:Nudix hydrolase 14 n=1 Tax=Planoprotostelium fungivorum TaxID=1890364 RepID=A0A2P6N4V4_9EUKA|nr:nudix hydrolase 14 [Planoprotostelium fungivorum]